MRKIFSMIVAATLLCAPMALAQEQVNTVNTSGQVLPPAQPAIQPPTTMDMPEVQDPLQLSVQGGGLWDDKNDRLHDGGEVIGRLTYDLTPYVAIGGESGALRYLDRSNGSNYGHLDAIPVMADLVLKMPIAITGNKLVPYVYGAGGVVVWHYDRSSYSENAGVEARTRAHAAAKPGAGLEYYLTPHVALFVEWSYLFSRRYDLRDASATPPGGKIDVDSQYGGGGIKVAF